MTVPDLFEALQALARTILEIQDHKFCVELEGRQYLRAEVESDVGVQDRIQGALQRLCARQGWQVKIKVKDGVQVKVGDSRAKGDTLPHALALALLAGWPQLLYCSPQQKESRAQPSKKSHQEQVPKGLPAGLEPCGGCGAPFLVAALQSTVGGARCEKCVQEQAAD